jgi:hypothetical protein
MSSWLLVIWCGRVDRIVKHFSANRVCLVYEIVGIEDESDDNACVAGDE